MKPAISIHEIQHFSPQAISRLKEHLTLNQPYFSKMDVLWCRLKQPDLDLYPNLRLLVCNMTDVSHLPITECQRRGIEVLSLKGIEGLDTVRATAEHTISLMLQALRHRCDRSSGRIGRELRGKEVCLIGYGRIGRQVEAILLPFLSPGYPYVLNSRRELEENPCYELEDADIVSIHASLNETSKGMVNAEFLSKLKPGCVLVNTARHAIVDETAILDWLDRDKEAIYAHDFGDEWQPQAFDSIEEDEALYVDHPQIIGTPHIGGWTLESLNKTEELLAERVIEWAKNHLEVTV